MELFEAITTRRSIRKYTDTSVPEDVLQELIRSAMDAPSAMDAQPWEFVIVNDRDLLQRIPQHHSHSDLVSSAPACILVCGNLEREKLPGFWIQDCSAATQNLLLAAHASGLGAVWVGVYPTDANVIGLKKLFLLPEKVIPFALIALGYPNEPYPAKENFDPTKIHFQSWGNAKKIN